MKFKVLIWFILISVYLILLYNVSPYVNSGDSGELITVACTLGVAHSPGYPLYSLLGKIFCYLIPYGNYAYRMNVMNVLLSIFTLISFISFLFRLYNDNFRIIFGIGVFLSFLFSESYFRNTVQAEVFILNIFLANLLMIWSYKEIKKPSLKNWYFLSFLTGLSLGNHHTIVFFVPSLIFIFFINKINIKKIPLLFLFFILGFSIYSVLPLRAAKEPYFNWGNPRKLKNLYRVITRKDYGTFQLTVEKPLKYDFNNLSFQCYRFFKKVNNDLGIFLIILIFLSFIKLYFSCKILFFYLISGYLLSGIGFLILSNLPSSELYDGILERFYILPNFIGISTVIFAATYIDKKFLKIMFLMVLFSIIKNLTINFHRCNYRNYYLNYDYGLNIMKTLLKNSFLLMDGGDDTFYTLGYMQGVEKRRTDVKLHDRGGLVFKSIYGEDFRSLTKEEKEKRRIEIEKILVKKFPVFYSTFNKNILPETKLRYAGVVYVVETNFLPSYYKKSFFREIYSYRTIYDKYYDYRSKALVPIYLFMEATNEEDVYKKVKLLKLCYFLWKEVDWLKNNIKIELHNEAYKILNDGDIALAKDIYEFILRIDPNDTNALLNLGVIFEKLNQFDLAKTYYYKVIEMNPYNPTAYYNLGVIFWKESNWDKVIEYFNKVLKIQPDNQQIRNYIEYAIKKRKS
ncbi:MAG: DUF2723 domain-containing protein [Endomicrobiia bacterium]